MAHGPGGPHHRIQRSCVDVSAGIRLAECTAAQASHRAGGPPRAGTVCSADGDHGGYAASQRDHRDDSRRPARHYQESLRSRPPDMSETPAKAGEVEPLPQRQEGLNPDPRVDFNSFYCAEKKHLTAFLLYAGASTHEADDLAHDALVKL